MPGIRSADVARYITLDTTVHRLQLIYKVEANIIIGECAPSSHILGIDSYSLSTMTDNDLS